ADSGNPVSSDVIPSDSPGHPLDHGTRNFMESRFGTDFSDVRVHTDSRAAESADALAANAYTTGRDIYFAAGKYAPSSDSGRRLLAHEVAHVVQQRSGKEPSIATKSSGGVKIGTPDDILETEAHAAEDFISRPTSKVTDREQPKNPELLPIALRQIQRQPQQGGAVGKAA